MLDLIKDRNQICLDLTTSCNSCGEPLLPIGKSKTGKRKFYCQFCETTWFEK